jgi:Zn-finger nucleic acid-binding protein
MNCPRCEVITLDEREEAGMHVDVCLVCRGIWLDRGELEALLLRARADEAGAPRMSLVRNLVPARRNPPLSVFMD